MPIRDRYLASSSSGTKKTQNRNSTQSTMVTPPVPIVATTGLSSEVVAVVWKIPNFLEILRNPKLVNTQSLELMVQGPNRVATRWKIFLRWKTEDLKEDDGGVAVMNDFCICVFHQLESKHPNIDVYSCMRVQIKNWDGARHPFYFNSKTEMMHMNGNTVKLDVVNQGYLKVIESKRVDAALALPHDSLTIHLELTVLIPNEPGLLGSTKAVMSKQEKLLSTKLASDLSNLQNCAELSDVKIVTMEGGEHLASKTMLSARSPVFARMFKSNLNEAATGVVKLEDISSQTMLTLLQYIYTGKVEFEDKSATDIMDLVYAADKYDLEELRQCCDEILCTKWNELSTAELLDGASKFRLSKTEAKLKEHVGKTTGHSS